MKKVVPTTKKIEISITDEHLSTERTILKITKKEGGGKEIKKKVEDYLNWLKNEYPEAKNGIDEIWNDGDTQKDWQRYSDATEKMPWVQFVRHFTFNETVIEKVKEGAGKKLKLLFSIDDSDKDDIKKDLKSQSIKGLVDDFESNYKADQIAWAVELCRNFYLNQLPQIIKKGLESEKPPLNLNDLDEASWKNVREKLFKFLYSSWTTTLEEKEITNLKKKLNESIVESNNLIEKTQKKVASELKSAKEKAKKESNDGTPWAWDLTQEEREKIDQAATKKELDAIVANIKSGRDAVGSKDLATANEWIKENILSKNKLEDLTVTDEDIEKALGSLKLPKNFVENAKQTLRRKRRELTPEPTTIEGKIEDLLIWFRDRVSYLKKGVGGKREVEVFKKYWETKMDKVIPLVEKALKTNTLASYKLLDEEWLNLKNQELGENNKNYNSEFDYFCWNTLRNHLEEAERTAKETKYNDLVDKIKIELGSKLGEEFLEIWGFESKIEVKEK